MKRQHAHPDPRVRYLAHEQVQPVDRWQQRAAAGFVCFVIGFLAVVAVVVR